MTIKYVITETETGAYPGCLEHEATCDTREEAERCVRSLVETCDDPGATAGDWTITEVVGE